MERQHKRRRQCHIPNSHSSKTAELKTEAAEGFPFCGKYGKVEISTSVLNKGGTQWCEQASPYQDKTSVRLLSHFGYKAFTIY